MTRRGESRGEPQRVGVGEEGGEEESLVAEQEAAREGSEQGKGKE